MTGTAPKFVFLPLKVPPIQMTPDILYTASVFQILRRLIGSFQKLIISLSGLFQWARV